MQWHPSKRIHASTSLRNPLLERKIFIISVSLTLSERKDPQQNIIVSLLY